MVQLDLIEYADAVKARDTALKQVASNSGDWFDLAMLCFERILPDLPATFTPEEWKAKILPMAGKPHHENAWGPVAMKAVKLGWIEKTGEYGHSMSLVSKKTVAPYYRRCS
jgi:hypothetical protein